MLQLRQKKGGTKIKKAVNPPAGSIIIPERRNTLGIRWGVALSLCTMFFESNG